MSFKKDKADPSRRQFLGQSMSCGAYVAALAALSPATARRVMACNLDEVVVKEKWGRIEKVSDGVWALVSDFSAGDFTTVCNGGIVAGDKGVLAIEAFMQPQGAKWLAQWAEKLTGRWPTDVVVTHFHGDHTAGDAGYVKEDGTRPRLWITEKTQQLVTQARQQTGADHLAGTERLPNADPKVIDLGNRKIQVTPRSGHTASDVTIEVQDPNVVFAGDLFFNRMVPNYSDALPRQLSTEIATLARDKESKYVPGHGPLAGHQDLRLYQDFLSMIEQSVKTAYDAGKKSEEAAAEFELRDPFKDWYIFAPTVMPRAFAAWYREFERESK